MSDRTDIDRALEMFKSIFPCSKPTKGKHDEEEEKASKDEGSVSNES